MVRSEVLAQYYADLRDPRFAVSFAVYHRRFSTNTLPRWPLAQPMRLLGHNGEINTLLGNLNWAKASEAGLEDVWGEAAADLIPVVNPDFSDSANLDATLELMVRSGRSITDSLITLVPEAFRNQPDLDSRPESRRCTNSMPGFKSHGMAQRCWCLPMGSAWARPWIAMG